MVRWTEKVISAIGGAVAILVIVGVSREALGSMGSATLIGSMGASAVLLFAVPRGALSQPWPVFGGHVISALIGVTVAQVWGDSTPAAAVAVGAAIGVMYQFRCIHPPGGATALAAVIGGEQVHELGYEFVIRPVMINAVTILVVAVVFNAAFDWRRYPAHIAVRKVPTGLGEFPPQARRLQLTDELTQDQIVTAMRSMQSFVDITEDDLRHIIRIVQANTVPREVAVAAPGVPGAPASSGAVAVRSERATSEPDAWSPPRGPGHRGTPPPR